MLHETCASIASAQAYAEQTRLRQVLRAYITWQNFPENNFADFLDEVRVKIIQILSTIGGVFIFLPILLGNYSLHDYNVKLALMSVDYNYEFTLQI